MTGNPFDGDRNPRPLGILEYFQNLQAAACSAANVTPAATPPPTAGAAPLALANEPRTEVEKSDPAFTLLHTLVRNSEKVSVARIAKEVGLTRQALYKNKQFMNAYDAATGLPMRGTKSRDGTIEAFDDEIE